MKRLTIIGAGIVGLATAYKLQQKYPGIKIRILEKETQVSAHQTGHNSGVIHSGIYYSPGSLKAKNCREGYKQLLRFCDQHNIPYELSGKLIVATEKKEIPLLLSLYEKGKQNGLKNLSLIEKNEIQHYEKYVEGEKAIWVPQTGIIDYKKVSIKLKELIEQKGGEFIFNEKVLDIKSGRKVKIYTDKKIYESDFVINAAGLYSDKLANKTGTIPFKIIPFRGEYYVLKPEKSYLVQNLIYPVPNPQFPFLGVHFTRKLSGSIEAGPNAVLALGRESYHKTQINLKELGEILTYPGFIKVASKYWKEGWKEMRRSISKKLFVQSLQKMIPQIKEEDLIPGGSGIRAQAVNKKGQLIDDFIIIKQQNILHVGNAPSPAATAALSIGDFISKQVEFIN
jgi:L-2-hydroxyglutarate oxidase